MACGAEGGGGALLRDGREGAADGKVAVNAANSSKSSIGGEDDAAGATGCDPSAGGGRFGFCTGAVALDV